MVINAANRFHKRYVDERILPHRLEVLRMRFAHIEAKVQAMYRLTDSKEKEVK